MADRVIFKGRFHKHNNCMCECCRNFGNVFILYIPIATYNKHGKLQMKYNTHIWLCDNCRSALATFLKEADNLKEKNNE